MVEGLLLYVKTVERVGIVVTVPEVTVIVVEVALVPVTLVPVTLVTVTVVTVTMDIRPDYHLYQVD